MIFCSLVMVGVLSNAEAGRCAPRPLHAQPRLSPELMTPSVRLSPNYCTGAGRSETFAPAETGRNASTAGERPSSEDPVTVQRARNGDSLVLRKPTSTIICAETRRGSDVGFEADSVCNPAVNHRGFAELTTHQI